MTYITGLFRQLCKMWPDMINSGEIQSTAKAILVFDGWVWGEVRAKYRGLQRRPQELSRWQQLEAPSFLIGPWASTVTPPANEVRAVFFFFYFLPWK